ncbi:MAG TPA: nodulation protein NfeD [Dehalococcoidia bacterium]|nr:nodulation protein NfeD [Dehalococcoidia bacterium]
MVNRWNILRGLKVLRIVLLLGLLVLSSTALIARAVVPEIFTIVVKGIINPVSADYINRGIQEAEEAGATVCIIQLDTPGGLDTAMRDIVQDIVNARIPVVVYVSPSGARAASAGAFITVAAHVAAMAPNTAIGAASPVSIGAEGEEQMSETMQEKVLNDAAAYIRSIAEAHGRNMDWAERAVREAVSATEQEALELNVIDMVAPDLASLILQLDGWETTLLDGTEVTIETSGAVIHHIEMNWVEEFLFAITDPNIAYVLLGLASLGLFVEISNPGLIFPGVAGGICAILAFYSLGNLPVNIAGILLVVGAFALFIAEVFTSSFGLLTGGGIISLILGSLILFKGGPLFQVNPWLIGIVAVCIGTLTAFIITRVVSVHRQQPTTGWEELMGKTALVKEPLAPEGSVLLKGERWTAVSEEGRIRAGETVVINRVESLKLYVTRIPKEIGD